MLFSKENWQRAVVWAVVGAGAAYVAWRLRLTLGTVLFAIVLTYLLKAPVDWLSRLRPFGWQPRQDPVTEGSGFEGESDPGRGIIPRWAATLLVFIVIGLVIWLLVALTAPSVVADARDLSAKLTESADRWPAALARFQERYQTLVPREWQAAIDTQTQQMREWVVTQARGVLQAIPRGVMRFVELVLVPVLAFYFLSDAGSIKQNLLIFLPLGYRPRVERVLREANDVFERYMQGQLILCAVAFVVVSLALWALHFRFAFTLGLLAGLTRAIPIVGPIFGGIPIVALGLARSPAIGLWLLAGFTLMHFFESKYLMPKVLGFKLGIHPVLIIISLLVGGEFFGLVGMFLAAPVLAIVQRLILHSRKETEPAPTS